MLASGPDSGARAAPPAQIRNPTNPLTMGAGKVTQELSESSADGGDTFANAMRWTYTYDAGTGRLSQKVRELWSAGAWQAADTRYTYSYAASGDVSHIVIAVWSGGAWQNANYLGYEFDGDGLMYHSTYGHYASNVETLELYHDFDYGSDRRVTGDHEYGWNPYEWLASDYWDVYSPAGRVLATHRTKSNSSDTYYGYYGYDDEGRVNRIIHTRSGVMSYRELFTYGPDGRLAGIARDQPDGDGGYAVFEKVEITTTDDGSSFTFEVGADPFNEWVLTLYGFGEVSRYL
jgi:hypothetical protein